MPKKQRTDAKPTLEQAIEAEIRAQLDVIATKRKKAARSKGDFDKDLALSTAALVRAQVSLENEKRQRIKAQRRALEVFTVEEIIDYLRSQPEAVRADVARELGGAEEEEPLL